MGMSFGHHLTGRSALPGTLGRTRHCRTIAYQSLAPGPGVPAAGGCPWGARGSPRPHGTNPWQHPSHGIPHLPSPFRPPPAHNAPHQPAPVPGARPSSTTGAPGTSRHVPAMPPAPCPGPFPVLVPAEISSSSAAPAQPPALNRCAAPCPGGRRSHLGGALPPQHHPSLLCPTAPQPPRRTLPVCPGSIAPRWVDAPSFASLSIPWSLGGGGERAGRTLGGVHENLGC